MIYIDKQIILGFEWYYIESGSDIFLFHNGYFGNYSQSYDGIMIPIRQKQNNRHSNIASILK